MNERDLPPPAGAEGLMSLTKAEPPAEPVRGNGADHGPPNQDAPPIGEPVGPKPIPKLEVLDVGDDDQPIPPREWLLGNAFCREFVSGLIAPGAGVKTSLRVVQALSLAPTVP